jgi:hypothetical protein
MTYTQPTRGLYRKRKVWFGRFVQITLNVVVTYDIYVISK